MAVLSKGCKPDNFESHSSLKFSFPIFEAFVWISLNVNLSLNQTLLTFLLLLRQTWMTQIILANSLRRFVFLKSKRTVLLIYMVLQSKWRVNYFFTGLTSRKLYKFMFITGFTSFSLLLIFPHPSSSLSLPHFLMLFYLKQIRFSQSTYLLMYLFLETFNAHHKDWLTYSGGNDRPGELCFLSQMTLLR